MTLVNFSVLVQFFCQKFSVCNDDANCNYESLIVEVFRLCETNTDIDRIDLHA